jgi:hypothetical protein
MDWRCEIKWWSRVVNGRFPGSCVGQHACVMVLGSYSESRCRRGFGLGNLCLISDAE